MINHNTPATPSNDGILSLISSLLPFRVSYKLRIVAFLAVCLVTFFLIIFTFLNSMTNQQIAHQRGEETKHGKDELYSGI